MNTKLRNLSLYLKSIGLKKESSLIFRFAQQENNLDSILEDFMKLDSLLSEKENMDSLSHNDLSKWKKLLAAAKGRSTFHYEVTLGEISSALSSEADALRSNFDIPVGSSGDREDALDALRSKSFNSSLENNADDQDSDESTRASIDYDKIYKNIDDTIKAIVSELPEDEANLVIESMQKEGFKKEEHIIDCPVSRIGFKDLIKKSKFNDYPMMWDDSSDVIAFGVINLLNHSKDRTVYFVRN